MKPRTELRKVSTARARENRLRTKTMEIVRRRDGHCKGLGIIPGKCFGGLHGHELRKSGQGGSRIDPANVVLMCDFHNGWIENEPIEAHRLGFVIWAEDLIGEVVRFVKWEAPHEVAHLAARRISIQTSESMSDEQIAHAFRMPFLGDVS